MKDAGLIFQNDLDLVSENYPAGQTSTFIYGPLILIFDRTVATPQPNRPVGALTKVGVELLKLVTIQPDMNYVKRVFRHFQARGVIYSWATIIDTDGDKIQYGNKTIIEL